MVIKNYPNEAGKLTLSLNLLDKVRHELKGKGEAQEFPLSAAAPFTNAETSVLCNLP